MTLLRWLSSLAIIGAVLGLVWPVLLIAIVLFSDQAIAWLLRSETLIILVMIVLVLSIPRVLLALSRCARCSRPLFRDRIAFRGTLRSVEGRDHDYRAKTFLNSFPAGAMLEMARTGGTRCMWCGHRLGDAPEYVVVDADS